MSSTITLESVDRSIPYFVLRGNECFISWLIKKILLIFQSCRAQETIVANLPDFSPENIRWLSASQIEGLPDGVIRRLGLTQLNAFSQSQRDCFTENQRAVFEEALRAFSETNRTVSVVDNNVEATSVSRSLDNSTVVISDPSDSSNSVVTSVPSRSSSNFTGESERDNAQIVASDPNTSVNERAVFEETLGAFSEANRTVSVVDNNVEATSVSRSLDNSTVVISDSSDSSNAVEISVPSRSSSNLAGESERGNAQIFASDPNTSVQPLIFSDSSSASQQSCDLDVVRDNDGDHGLSSLSHDSSNNESGEIGSESIQISSNDQIQMRDVRQLSTEQRRAWLDFLRNEGKMQLLTSEQISLLQDDFLGSDMDFLTNAQIQGFDFKRLNDDQCRWMFKNKRTLFDAIPIQDLQRSPANLRTIITSYVARSKVKELDANALTTTQLYGTDDYSGLFSDFGQIAISDFTPEQVVAMQSKLRGFTLSRVTRAQAQALRVVELTDEQVGEMFREGCRLSSFTPEQVVAMQPRLSGNTLSRVTDEQALALRVAELTDEQVSVMFREGCRLSSFTPEQVAAMQSKLSGDILKRVTRDQARALRAADLTAEQVSKMFANQRSSMVAEDLERSSRERILLGQFRPEQVAAMQTKLGGYTLSNVTESQAQALRVEELTDKQIDEMSWNNHYVWLMFTEEQKQVLSRRGVQIS